MKYKEIHQVMIIGSLPTPDTLSDSVSRPTTQMRLCPSLSQGASCCGTRSNLRSFTLRDGVQIKRISQKARDCNTVVIVYRQLPSLERAAFRNISQIQEIRVGCGL